MKNIYILFLLATPICFSQIPAGYYNSATGVGYTLKSQLKTIITTGHVDQGYGSLYTGYQSSDNDSFYDNDNTVLDMYSEDPSGMDPYNYNHNNRNCGNYDSENDCYNREHIFPQGLFDQNYPMRSDIHHVVPSDGYVNGRRSNYPFGEVSSPTWTSMNGSKVGNNVFPGYTGIVFEPINEFKGDIARMLLYFAVRYEDNWNDSGWDAHTTENNPLNGTSAQFYESWYIQLLYQWHTNDPVNLRETTRNTAAYNYQGNANPFINHPEYVLEIWGSLLSASDNTYLNSVKIFPNPVRNDGIVHFATVQDLNIIIYDILGKQVLTGKVTSSQNSINISNLNKGMYLVKLKSDHGEITKKLIKQ